MPQHFPSNDFTVDFSVLESYWMSRQRISRRNHWGAGHCEDVEWQALYYTLLFNAIVTVFGCPAVLF